MDHVVMRVINEHVLAAMTEGEVAVRKDPAPPMHEP